MSDNQGSFVAGLSIGVLAGAAGYFLFGTDKGIQLRRELEKEWQAAQASGVIPAQIPDKDWRFTQSVFGTIQHIVKDMAEQQAAIPAPTRRARKPAAKKPDRKFKGI